MFDQNGWPIRYQLTSSQVLAFLLSHGVQHIIAFQYAHKPGVAHKLNKYMAAKSTKYDDRVMYGSDFPNIPYAWDIEFKILKRTNISYDALEKIAYKNAAAFFSLKFQPVK